MCILMLIIFLKKIPQGQQIVGNMLQTVHETNPLS